MRALDRTALSTNPKARRGRAGAPDRGESPRPYHAQMSNLGGFTPFAHALQRMAGNAATRTVLSGPLRPVAVQRCGPIPCDCPREKQERIAVQFLEAKAGPEMLPVQRQSPGSFSAPGCPPTFCMPFPPSIARADRAMRATGLLAGVSAFVDARVVPLWRDHINGGSSPRNLSTVFGADFTASPTTVVATDFLARALETELTAHPPAFPTGSNTVTLPLARLIGPAITEVGDPTSSNKMNFNVPSDVPGNLAGNIGLDQTAHPIGALPSPFNDARLADGTVTVTLNPDGSLTTVPAIRYTVRDTIDLCPGDCGAPLEWIATIPFSQWEASGISGDVPFTVNFPAPPRTLTIHPTAPLPPPIPPPPTPPAPPTPVTGTTTASMLRIRQTPSTTAPILGHYPRGTVITIECQATGTDVLGNTAWNKTDRGYVSDHYVNRARTPRACPP